MLINNYILLEYKKETINPELYNTAGMLGELNMKKIILSLVVIVIVSFVGFKLVKYLTDDPIDTVVIVDTVTLSNGSITTYTLNEDKCTLTISNNERSRNDTYICSSFSDGDYVSYTFFMISNHTIKQYIVSYNEDTDTWSTYSYTSSY